MIKDYMQKAGAYLAFWNDLTEEDKNKLNKSAKLLTGKKGSLLHGGLTDCSGIIITLSGSLRSYILSEEGREVTLYRLKKGDVCVFSASCILKNIDFDIFISSETSYEAVLLNTNDFEEIKNKNKNAQQFINDIISKRFSDVMWTIEKILFLSMDKRLALYILEQAELSKSNTIKQTHEEIAKSTGSAREVVTRMLNYFAEEGYVNLSRGSITILDKESLESITKNTK